MSTDIIKINKRGHQQSRILVVTTKSLYNIKQSSVIGKLFNQGLKIRAKFSIAHLESIIYGKKNDEMVLTFPSYFDLHYSSKDKDQILDYIFLSRQMECPDNNNIEFFFLDDKTLSKYCTHPSKPASRRPKEESMIVNREEFLVHFLGQEQKNLIPNAQPIKLKDFEFMQMLGIGGFSKVYLVKKRGTKELYAMKSIRLPNKKLKSEKDKYKEQVRNERDILVSIKHPFIVKLKYAFQLGRRFFFVMPFIQ